MWGIVTFLEKNHIDILGDSYACRDKSWSSKPGKNNQATQRIKALEKSK